VRTMVRVVFDALHHEAACTLRATALPRLRDIPTSCLLTELQHHLDDLDGRCSGDAPARRTRTGMPRRLSMVAICGPAAIRTTGLIAVCPEARCTRAKAWAVSRRP